MLRSGTGRGYGHRNRNPQGSGAPTPTPAAAALWTPASAPANTWLLWYDPSDAATVTQVAGVASQITDKSGSGFTLAASGTTKPSWAYNEMAQEAFGFDRVDDCLTSVSSAIAQNQPFVIYQTLWPVLGGGINESTFDGNGTILWRPNQGGNPLLFAGSVYFPAITMTAQYSQQIMARYSGATGYLSKDAGSEVSGAIGSNNFSGTVRLGSTPTNDSPYGGDIGETLVSKADIVTGSALDQNTRGYLAWQWGTWETLPSNYPYRKAAPLASGAAPAVPSVGQTLFIAHGTSGAYYATNIFDPCIVDHPSDSTKLIMYASGQQEPPGSGVASIGRWIIDKTNPTATPALSGVVLTTGGPAWNNEAGGVRLGSVIYTGGTYYMYFCTQQTGTAIGVATSTDSINFTIQTTQILVPSGDETQLGEPAIWWEGGVATIIYDYRTGVSNDQILPGYRYATSSSLLGPFTKAGGQDILRRPRKGLQIEFHQIVKRNGTYYMLIECGGNPTDATPYRIYLGSCATLTGRYKWRKLVLAEAASGALYHVATPGLFTINGTDYLYYTGAPDFAQPYGQNRWNMYVAAAPTGIFD